MIIQAILFGIVEGLTEFLPISSTAHLILTHAILPLQSENSETFMIAIQLGAILAVLIRYRRYFLAFVSPRQWLSRQTGVLLTAILPVLVAGLCFYKLIKAALFSIHTIGIGLFVGALIMIWVQRRYRPETCTSVAIEQVTYRQALIIGCCQCASLWPGMSRSGSTIVGGLLAKLSYQTAAEFSFIIAVPVMICAVSYDLLSVFSLLTSTDIQLISLGFLVSFLMALVAMSTFLTLLSRWQLTPFAFYRIGLALIIFFGPLT